MSTIVSSSHSPSSSSSSSSSSSKSGSRSPKHSKSLSPAHSIKNNHQRRPSPLKRQMSLGNGGSTSLDGPLIIDPVRTRTGGPLAVLYSVAPDEDPLLQSATSSTKVNGLLQSPSRSPSRSRTSSPFTTIKADDSILDGPALHQQSRSGALAAVDRAPLPSSPNRSLLSAFQAVSPRAPSASAPRSSSAPSLTTALNVFASPRSSSGLSQAATFLAPASPISTSPRQSMVPQAGGSSSNGRSSFATAAFRALNGASPTKPSAASRASSSGSRNNGSGYNSATQLGNVSPVRSRSSNALRSIQNDEPTWQIYRDPVAATSASSVTGTQYPSEESAEEMFDFDEDLEKDEIAGTDENNAPVIDSENISDMHSTRRSHDRAITTGIAHPASAPVRAHRRSSLSVSMLPDVEVLRERDTTPPPNSVSWQQATQSVGRDEVDGDAPTSSAQRARKRPRTSGDLH